MSEQSSYGIVEGEEQYANFDSHYHSAEEDTSPQEDSKGVDTPLSGTLTVVEESKRGRQENMFVPGAAGVNSSNKRSKFNESKVHPLGSDGSVLGVPNILTEGDVSTRNDGQMINYGKDDHQYFASDTIMPMTAQAQLSK